MRIAIAGYPNSGKSTLASILSQATGVGQRSTDELLDTHDWSELSAAVADWFTELPSWIIEGVAVPRALRKWHAKHPRHKAPLDIFIYIQRPHTDYRPGQRAMANGLDTVMVELWTWLRESGVTIHKLGPQAEDE